MPAKVTFYLVFSGHAYVIYITTRLKKEHALRYHKYVIPKSSEPKSRIVLFRRDLLSRKVQEAVSVLEILRQTKITSQIYNLQVNLQEAQQHIRKNWRSFER